MNNKNAKRNIQSTSSLRAKLSTFNFQLSTRDASRGFTLIELMVSLTLFVIVVMAAVGSLYTVNQASQKVSAMRSVLDNLNFAMENMSRTIRTGSNIVCGGSDNGLPTNNCPFGTYAPSGPEFAIDRISVASTLGQDQDIEYWLDDGSIVKKIGSDSPVRITSPEIDVQKLAFYVDGADKIDGASSSDDKQPSVIMFVQGVATAEGNIAPFAIQTFVSQRAVE